MSENEKRSERLKRKREQFYDEDKVKRHKDSLVGTCILPVVPENNSKDLPHPVRCTRDFYTRPCVDLARALLGCVLVKCSEGKVCKGIIVETEAYLGGEDKAAHSFAGKKTERNAAMFMAPGTAYVYSVYGMHHCFNVSSDGDGAAVLVRALEPYEGMEEMAARRKGAKKKTRELCNGPAKLCEALGIDKSSDKLDLVTSATLWVERRGSSEVQEVTVAKRVGVEYAEEWADKPLRFYISGNACVSKK
eukprot:Em0020g1080a